MSTEYKIINEGNEETVTINHEEGGYVVTLGEVSHRFETLLTKSPVYSFLVDGHQVLEAEVSFKKDQASINVGHVPYKVEIFDPRRRLASQAGAGGAGANSALIEAPMPGKVVDIKLNVGDVVATGQPVIVVEAMKMQNELASPIDGVVTEIKVAVGDTVESGKPLVLISKAAEAK